MEEETDMKKLTLVQYNRLQMTEMEKHRWIESEKVGYDLGEGAYLDWIKTHSKKFREEYKRYLKKYDNDNNGESETISEAI